MHRTYLLRFSTLLAGAFFVPGLFAGLITNQSNITWYAEQGTNRNGTTITDPLRTDSTSIFTSAEGEWLSLGFTSNPTFGGKIYGIADPGYFLSGTLIIQERTNGVKTANYPEAARLIFSGSLAGATDLSLDLLRTPPVCMPANANCVASFLNGDTTKWRITGFEAGYFTKVTLTDITKTLKSKASTDGFDIDYISISSSSVPEPSTWAMLGAGVVALVCASQYRNWSN